MALLVRDATVVGQIGLKMGNSEKMITARNVICTVVALFIYIHRGSARDGQYHGIVTDRPNVNYGVNSGYGGIHGNEPQNNYSTHNPVVSNLWQQITQFNSRSSRNIQNDHEVCSKYQEYQTLLQLKYNHSCLRATDVWPLLESLSQHDQDLAPKCRVLLIDQLSAAFGYIYQNPDYCKCYGHVILPKFPNIEFANFLMCYNDVNGESRHGYQLLYNEYYSGEYNARRHCTHHHRTVYPPPCPTLTNQLECKGVINSGIWTQVNATGCNQLCCLERIHIGKMDVNISLQCVWNPLSQIQHSGYHYFCQRNLITNLAYTFNHYNPEFHCNPVSSVYSATPVQMALHPTTTAVSTTSLPTTVTTMVYTTPTMPAIAIQTCDKYGTITNIAHGNVVSHPSAGDCILGDHRASEALLFKLCHTNGAQNWTQGPSVMNDCAKLPLYTPVATFFHGSFSSNGGQAGIFLGCLSNGFKLAVQECFANSTVLHIEKGGHLLRDPDIYSVVLF